MTVYNENLDEIKIILTHTEVIACFGSYEKLTLMGDNIKTSLSLLISEITRNKIKNPEDYEIKGKIIARKNFGCNIVLKLYKTERLKNLPTIFIFKHSEDLIFAVKTVFSFFKNVPSDLYLMPDGYRLVIKKSRFEIVPSEFNINVKNSNIDLAFTEEYGKPLILNDAIYRLRKAFIKDF